MMKIALTAIVLTVSFAMHGQSGYKHLNLDAGINLEGNYSYNMGLELNRASFSAWEISVQYHRSRFESLDSLETGEPPVKRLVPVEKKEELYLAGVYYKPLLAKQRNLVYNFRYGLLIGRSNNFLLGAGAGLEVTYHFSSLFAIYARQSNHYIINVDDRFRHSINLGVKIPF